MADWTCVNGITHDAKYFASCVIISDQNKKAMARTVTSYIAFYLFSAKNRTCILFVTPCYRSH